MRVSSRIAEGFSNRCLLCQNEFVIEPSYICDDATCPVCGTLLWFVTIGIHKFVYEQIAMNPIRRRFRELLAIAVDIEETNLPEQTLTKVVIGSPDLVELLIELKEECDIDIENLGDFSE